MAFSDMGDQQLTVDNTAGGVALTMPTSKTPRHALIYVGGADIRWLGGTTAPTATVGVLVTAGSYIDWTDPEGDYRGIMRSARFIRTGGASATLDILYLT